VLALSAAANNTAEKPRGRPFEPGNNANPKGRPKGSRNALGEDFLKALHADFTVHGPDVIATVRAEKPDQYLKVVASILPKQAEITINEYDNMDDGQLRTALSAALRDLATLGIDIGATASPSAGQAAANEPAKAVSPLH
jgi:hypothetical protein